MATRWMKKSLHCNSSASADVVITPHRHRRHSLPNSSSCRSTVRNLIDIIDTSKHNKPIPIPNPPDPPFLTRPDPTRSTLMELPPGHPSRNVVEIIFHTSWGPNPFTGRVDMVFKVHNLNRTLSRFEEYRQTVRSRAFSNDVVGGEDHARCVADGNEIMRFCCLGAADGGAYEVGGGPWGLKGGGGGGFSTYSGSGLAHEKAGGGCGRSAMLVCRVIAGRVERLNPFGYGYGYDSVSKEEGGELVVYDTRALLPCFLVIYSYNTKL